MRRLFSYVTYEKCTRSAADAVSHGVQRKAMCNACTGSAWGPSTSLRTPTASSKKSRYGVVPMQPFIFAQMLLKKIGTFRIKESFNITGRGIITIGHFIEGRAKIGAFAAIDILGQRTTAKITGINWPKLDPDGNSIWGLLFSFDDKNIEEIVKGQKLKEQTIEILFNVQEV